jgi:hypothetical protein
MHSCPICGEANATCGGPTTVRAIDETITRETNMADNDMEMVTVHVDDGTTRGHDRVFTRKDAAKFMEHTPNAQIMEPEAPAEEEMPADEPEAKMMDGPAENKAKKPAASK